MMSDFELPRDAFGFPLNAAGPLPDEAFGIEGVERYLEGAEIVSNFSVRSTLYPDDEAKQTTMLHVVSYWTTKEGETVSYIYLVALTGTVHRPAADSQVRWLGLRHLVGNIYHASGWMPWEPADGAKIVSWDQESAS